MRFFKTKMKKITEITSESSNSQDMSYYIMIRETIHGLDGLITKVIYQSVTIITGSLTLAVLLFEKIQNPYGATLLAFALTIIAFSLTRNSRRRTKLLSDLLTTNVEVAAKLENLLLSDDSIKITQLIEKNVEYAGRRGERIFLKSMQKFYWIEGILSLYFITAFCLTLFGMDIRI